MEPDPRVQLISEYCYLFTGGAGGDHAFVMSATRFWHRITVECDLPSILPVALSAVLSVGIFNALTTSALGVRKFANCVPVRSLNRFLQWRQ
jgi:hypothetical protein